MNLLAVKWSLINSLYILSYAIPTALGLKNIYFTFLAETDFTPFFHQIEISQKKNEKKKIFFRVVLECSVSVSNASIFRRSVKGALKKRQ